ncbi:SpoIID/LytB domain-containing protein [Phormidium sp. CLA17]|uniref:SpoIID/LytB domain-containing protein n=1 Tax=Leptolyngbya sp. Cla-17 TaxID=2803751 RepID=UPI0014930FE0|nr:SpoIID/LytB domain-containing protein [Leptolyngbya sp. Cla-17]MBM0744060.1 SpoIID/LytB domain-containing protein [Leptolyngbya sp. Cla-17]
MDRHAIFDWIKQNPWLIVPVLGLIPLLNLPFAKSQPSLPPTSVTTSTPMLPTSVSTMPSLVSASPSPRVTPSPRSVPVSVSVKKLPQKKSTAPLRKPVAASIPLPANLSVDAAIEMRVAIASGVTTLPISTSMGGVILGVNGRPIHTLPAQSTYTVEADGQGLLLDSMQLPSVVVIDSTPNGLIRVGDRDYRGRMLLVLQEGRLWAVNYVSMQYYLYSVVGSEVSPSWPMEALKAQAVAARSYALTYHIKPVNRQFYDMGDDEYYQVYKGIESETDTTRQAVNSTRGEFVSYRGGVVESLYAATDDIVIDAFQGKGMSQVGALGLAEKGYGYRAILGNYYAGTGIGRIEMDME